MSGIDPSDPEVVRRRLDGLRSEFAGLGSGGGLLRGAAALFRELFGLAGTLSALVGSLQDRLTEEVAKNSALRDQLARYERQQYGRRSEKRRNSGASSDGASSDGAASFNGTLLTRRLRNPLWPGSFRRRVTGSGILPRAFLCPAGAGASTG